MKTYTKIDILKKLLLETENKAMIRVYESAIAALEYCEKEGLTYYVEEKEWK